MTSAADTVGAIIARHIGWQWVVTHLLQDSGVQLHFAAGGGKALRAVLAIMPAEAYETRPAKFLPVFRPAGAKISSSASSSVSQGQYGCARTAVPGRARSKGSPRRAKSGGSAAVPPGCAGNIGDAGVGVQHGLLQGTRHGQDVIGQRGGRGGEPVPAPPVNQGWLMPGGPAGYSGCDRRGLLASTVKARMGSRLTGHHRLPDKVGDAPRLNSEPAGSCRAAG